MSSSSASKEDNLHTYEQALGGSPQDRSRPQISSRRVPTSSESESHLSLSPPETESPSCPHTPRASHPVVKEFQDISIEHETDADVLEVLAPDDLCLGEMQDLHRPPFPMVPGFMDVLSADTMECGTNMNFECMFHLPLNNQAEDGTSMAASRADEKSTIEKSLDEESSGRPLSDGQFKQRNPPIGLGCAHDGIQVIEEFRSKDNRNNETIERENEGTLVLAAAQNGSNNACGFHNQSTVSVSTDNNLKTSTHSATSPQAPLACVSTDRGNKMDDVQRSMQGQESTGSRQSNVMDRRSNKCVHNDHSSGDNSTCDKFPETSSCNHHYPEEAKGPVVTEKSKDSQETRFAHEALIAELNFIKVNGIAEQVEEELMQRHPLSSGWISPSGLVDITSEDVEELRRVNYAVYKLYQHMTDDQHHQEVALSAMTACLMRSSQEQMIASEHYDACKLQAASIHKIATRRRALVKLHLDSRGKPRVEVEAEGKKPEVWSSESQRFPRSTSGFRGRYIRSGRGFHEQTRASHHDLQGNGNYHDVRGRAPESISGRGRFEGQSGGRGSRCWVEYAGQRNSPYLINRRSLQR